MSDEKMFKIGDRVKPNDAYKEQFSEEHKGIIIDVIDMSNEDKESVDYSKCAVISVKDKLEYINFDWLELVE